MIKKAQTPWEALGTLIIVCLLTTVAFFACSETIPSQEKPGARAKEGFEIKKEPIVKQISAHVKALRKESLQQSLDNLSIPEMYFWPGTAFGGKLPPSWFPMVPEIGQKDIENIMSNRRFLKVYSELSALPKDQAAKLLKEHILEGTKKQKAILASYIKNLLPYAKKGDYIDIPVAISEAENPTLHGWRLKVLALIFIAGNLEDGELFGDIATVVAEGNQQYDVLRTDLGDMAHPMIQRDSLYHRQILATALLKTAADNPESRALWKKFAGHWSTQKLTRYDAEFSVYDFPSSRGFVDPDYTGGQITVRYLNPLTDDQFNEIVDVLLPPKGKNQRPNWKEKDKRPHN